VIRQDVLDHADQVIRQARAQGRPEVAAEALGLLASALRLMGQARDEYLAVPDPMTRACARVEDPVITAGQGSDGDDEPEQRPDGALRKLRMGRDRCTACRRDGQPCQAPAIENGLVCRRHGGAAPQVAIAAERMGKQLKLYKAVMEANESIGTAGEFEALCSVTQAEQEVADYEVKMRLLAELRAERLRRSAAATPMTGQPEQPEEAQMITNPPGRDGNGSDVAAVSQDDPVPDDVALPFLIAADIFEREWPAEHRAASPAETE
jgi:hypothetical protein